MTTHDQPRVSADDSAAKSIRSAFHLFDFEYLAHVLSIKGRSAVGVSKGTIAQGGEKIAMDAINHSLLGCDALARATNLYVFLRTHHPIGLATVKTMMTRIRNHAPAASHIVYTTSRESALETDAVELVIVAGGIV